MLLDVEVLRDLDEELKAEPPEALLWHYTSVASAVSILESRTVRLSCHVGMNDPAEGTIAASVVRDSWCEVLDSAGLEVKANEYLQAIFNGVERHFDYASRPELPATFLFSLTELRDSLSQWARYGADGEGIALGFRVDAAALPKRTGRNWITDTRLSRVLYDGPESRAVRPMLVAIMKKHFPTRLDGTAWQNTLIALVHALNPLLKQGAYHEEQEWRIATRTVIDSAELYQIRANKFGISPSIDLHFGDALEVAEVMIGPKLAGHNVWTAKWMCKKFDHDSEISRSALGYR